MTSGRDAGLPEGIRRAFRLVRRSSRIRRDVDDEIAFHLDMRVADLTSRGMPLDEARADALRRFGDRAQWSSAMTDLDREMIAHRRRMEWLSDLRQDLRYGLRFAMRAPLFSALAILTIALGVGANTAVFSVVKSVLLDALPYADAGRLARLHARKNDGSLERLTLSAAEVMDIRQRVRSFSQLGVFLPMPLEVAYARSDGAESLSAGLAGDDFFQTLGVRAALGRTLRDQDAVSGAPSVVLLSHAAWQRVFGGDTSVVGRVVRLNGAGATVIGVLPRDFVSPMGGVDAWFPLDITETLRDPIRARRRAWLGVVARLRPGVTPEAANREIHALSAQLAREHPESDALVTLWSLPLRDDMVGETRTPLLVLMASAGLVLLIACANLAGAMLARAIARRKEFAVRVALGAGSGRLVRQLLAESTLLAVIGGVLGVWLASLALRGLDGLAVSALPPYAHLGLDPAALMVTSLLALAAGLAFGAAPAAMAGRVDPQGTLRDASRGASDGHRAHRLRGVLVAGQIALCVSLVAGAGLLARSLWAMTSAPIGFDPAGVVTGTIQLPPARYSTADARVRFHDQLVERLRAVPGVDGAAFSSARPGDIESSEGITVDGAPAVPENERPFVLYASVSDGYFSTLHIPVMQGRSFTTADRADGAPVVVISESMARRYWPEGDALGGRVRVGPDPAAPWNEVIGIVGDVRNGPTSRDVQPTLYASSRSDPWGDVVLVRGIGDPHVLLRTAQRELTTLDPELPIHDPGTLEDVMSAGLTGKRLPVMLMSAFGALALLLASVGIYAMFAAMAAARSQEFGIRLALGSSRRAIASLVLRQGGTWMGIGLAAGTVGAGLVAYALRDLLYDVSPYDPVALGVTVAVLVTCATMALLVPVRRAMRVDATAALR